MTEFTYIFQYLCLEEIQRKGKKDGKKEQLFTTHLSEFLLKVDIWCCPSPPSLPSPARAANRHYKGLSTIEVLIDAILMLSIITNYNNLQHVHREVRTKERLVTEIVQWQLKHLWLAAASKLLEMSIYINKDFPLPKGAYVSCRVCCSFF